MKMAYKGNEDFMLTIDETSLPNGITPGNPDEAIVTIVDNDRKLLRHNHVNMCKGS